MSGIKRLQVAKREKGAVAIILAVAMVILMASAALGVDIAKLVYERQQLRNALDAAAAAGAQQLLSNPDQAKKDARDFAVSNMPGIVKADVGADLRCVVGYNKDTNSPDWATVSSLCGITTKTFDAKNCNEAICSIPCTTTGCNTIVVSYKKTVDYSFGPAIGIPTGSTGVMVSAACRGFCGKAIPNPMDVVVMADRTPSMSSTALQAMKDGIVNMLGTMNSKQQFVALGTIALGVERDSCLNATPKDAEAFTNADYWTSGTTWSPTGKLWKFNGKWVSVPYSSNYSKFTSTGIEVDTTSSLYKSVANCTWTSSDTVDYPAPTANWSNNSKAGDRVDTNEGTHLASALKGAAKYLLDSSNLTDMPARPDLGEPRKVLIFETDGAPSEIFNSSDTALSLDNPYDIGVAGSGGSAKACSNLVSVATAAKTRGIMIIAIGYGAVNTARCKSGDDDTRLVRDVLAESASKTVAGIVSTASDCTSATDRSKENKDGDNYFCGASADDLKGIFLTAMGQIDGHGRLMSLPGIN